MAQEERIPRSTKTDSVILKRYFVRVVLLYRYTHYYEVSFAGNSQRMVKTTVCQCPVLHKGKIALRHDYRKLTMSLRFVAKNPMFVAVESTPKIFPSRNGLFGKIL